MTEHAPDRMWSNINIPKTIAGVLAAVSAAVVGSFLGVAGTLAGAAVASIIGSVGTEIYQWWIERGRRRLRTTFVTAPAAVGTPAVPAGAEESPSQLEPAPVAGAPRRLRWGHVILVAAGMFVLAIGTLTVFELVSGKSAADAVGNRSSSTTTVCSVFCGGNDNATPAPAPSKSATPEPTSTGPTGTPTSEPTQPTGTTAPETTGTTEPAPTATTGDGTGTGSVVTPTQRLATPPAQRLVTPPAQGTE